MFSLAIFLFDFGINTIFFLNSYHCIALLSDGVDHQDILFNHLTYRGRLICAQQCGAPVNQMN